MSEDTESYGQFVADITRLIVDYGATVVPMEEGDRPAEEGDPISGDHLARYQAALS